MLQHPREPYDGISTARLIAHLVEEIVRVMADDGLPGIRSGHYAADQNDALHLQRHSWIRRRGLLLKQHRRQIRPEAMCDHVRRSCRVAVRATVARDLAVRP